MIYLDNAASTPLLPEVKEHLISILDIYGNPSSVHSEGIKAKELIDNSKQIISNIINCSEDEIYFTTGATMSNNIVLQGFGGRVVVSDIEHEDIQMIAEEYGMPHLAVNIVGKVSYSDIEKYLIDNTPTLFSIQWANSEIGTIQNIEFISRLIHKYPNKYLHVDATQYIPYYPVDVKKLNIDALSMSGQKIGCIKGTGLLYLSNDLKIAPLILGAQGLIGGTENVIGISCLGKAFECLNYDNTHLLNMRQKFYEGLQGDFVGDLIERLPNNINVCYKGVDALDMVYLLDQYGICCSTGSACTSGSREPSHTLKAIGMDEKDINSCIRFTLSKKNTEEEIEEAIFTINKVAEILRGEL